MAKTKSQTKTYAKPNRKPTFKFLNQATSTVIEAWETMHSVEVFQTQSGREQRVVMPNSQFDNFYNTILNNGFVKV